MVEKILKILNCKDIYQSQMVCRRWKEIIVKGKLAKKALGKISTILLFLYGLELKLFEILLSLGRITGIIVARDVGSYVVVFLPGDLGIKRLADLPHEMYGSCMDLHNGNILLCGGHGNSEKCLQLSNGTWKEHSTLNKSRVVHSVVTTHADTFVFGGGHSDKTYEYLPKDSTKWLIGENEIPGGFSNGCVIAVKSEQEIWLIGGRGTEKRILNFNIKRHTFQELPFLLNVGRRGHKCAFIPNTKKIMITGGYSLTQSFIEV